ncbi:unnamed protein product [Symbiodinium natans]|uniref:Peptidase A1 domain-containing protein n=1 Tax=Symbiodinium natans TaxID=878477 RepID=A0A812H2E5_9DINO|nr:unnamed protein product [Symbiodinium natans]
MTPAAPVNGSVPACSPTLRQRHCERRRPLSQPSGPSGRKVISSDDSSFRWCRRAVLGFASWLALPSRASRARSRTSEVDIPLWWAAGGFCLQFSLDSGSDSGLGGKRRIKAVADTGSPFLLLAKCLRPDCRSYCAEVGCFEGQGAPSGEADSVEGYASGLVEVAWRRGGRLTFPDATEAVELPEMRFGVQGRIIGFGGTGKAVFLGLIRDHMSDVKTSFLEQTPFQIRHSWRRYFESATCHDPSATWSVPTLDAQHCSTKALSCISVS